MADNPFAITPVNPLQALLLGQQSYDTSRKRAEEQAQIDAIRAAAPHLAAGDYKSALGAVGQGGNPSVLFQLAGLAERQKALDLQQAHQKTMEGYEGRKVSLAEQTAAEAAKGYDYREIDDGSGGKTLVRIEKATGAVSKPPISGVQTEPNNPFSYGKLNENQSKDAGFANRMFQTETIFRNPKIIAAGSTLSEVGKSKVPVAGNYMVSDEFQAYDQAARDFINATLRRESGAAINQSEFDNAYKQYLPRPGDSPAVLAQKQKNRQTTIASIAGGGGPAYKPPYRFGPKGELIDTGAGMQGERKSVAAPENDRPEISDARMAIGKGAPRKEVEARLRKMGIPFKSSDLDLN